MHECGKAQSFGLAQKRPHPPIRHVRALLAVVPNHAVQAEFDLDAFQFIQPDLLAMQRFDSPHCDRESGAVLAPIAGN